MSDFLTTARKLLVSLGALLFAATPAFAERPASEASEPAAREASESADTDDESAVIASEGKLTREAETPAEDETVDLQYRIWGQSIDHPTFDGTSEQPASRTALYQRLRPDVDVEFGTLRLKLEVDAVAGRLAGDTRPDVPENVQTDTAPRGEAFGDIENLLDPRNVYAAWNIGVGEIRLGLQTSNYGLGIVANDGSEDVGNGLFNQQYGGDRGLRAIFATKPFAAFSPNRILRNIFIVLGGDVLVYRDDNASYIDEDEASQFITSVFYRDENPMNPEEKTFVGTYFAFRDQEDRDGDFLTAAAYDVAASKSWTEGDGAWTFELAAETALIAGETDRAYTSRGETETDILGLGAAAEASARWNPSRLELGLNTGYASGDANTDDDTLYRFRFDPNYNVGLVLFDHYIPAVTREAYERVIDPTRTAQPPKGVEGFISDGAVENAIYLNPHIFFGHPDELLTGIGFLYAWSAEPFASPFDSFSNGGAPTGIRGGEASRDMGFEVDVAARYRIRLVSQLKLELKGEYGIFFPGDAFDDELGEPASAQSLIRGRLALLW